MKIEITNEQGICLKLILSVYTKQANEKNSSILEEIAKIVAPIAFEIERNGF